jgi:PAS domain S-box-containing protein
MVFTSSAKRRVLPRLSHRTGLVTAFLFILANSTFALLAYHEVRQTNDLVMHTQEVMGALQDVRELIQRTGSGQRGYLFTHDEKFLTQYEQAEDALPALLDKVRTMLSGSPDLITRIAGLATDIEADRRRLASGISQARSDPGSYPTANAMLANRLQTDVLANSIGPIRDGTGLALHKRIDAVEQHTTLALLLVSIATITSVAVIAVMLYRMQGEARARSTELAGTGAALRDSEQRFRSMFEESPLGIVLAQAGSLRIVQANPAFCGMLGYDADELAAKAIPDIAHIDDRDLLINVMGRTSGSSHAIESRCVTRSGVVAWTRIRVTLLSTTDQHDALLLVLTEDITREMQVEAELRQAQKMEAIGQLTGGIAHDFNNLLGVIIGNVEFLLDVVREDKGHSELAKEILNSALSGADLTRRLLAFARRQTLQPRRIDLNAYLPNHIAIVRRLIGETIQITTKLAGDLWSTRADPSQVGDALLNLAINARDAMPHGGRLSIETANAHLGSHHQDTEVMPGDYVVLSVTDTGTGMPSELLARVVEPFFTTKPPGAGSGLGLSMIYGFAKQSGGFLTIDSEPGLGTTVGLYLPRVQGADADMVGTVPEASLPAGDEAILLVDDNIEMRTVTRRHLASLGYRVSEAGSGPAALAILQDNNDFDLLFTDVVMPDGMTGYQLASVAQQLHPGLRVLFTTGYSRSLPGAEAVVAHPGAMLRKPYRKKELATTVRAALEA